jgi:hypothetical protein
MRITGGLTALGLAAFALAMALGGPARAAGAADDARRLAAAVLAPREAPAPHSVMPVLGADAGPTRIPGVAKTAVDRRLDDGATGSLGFLCGLQPGADKYGAGAAHGYDPTGRFVGAKLSFAFR